MAIVIKNADKFIAGVKQAMIANIAKNKASLEAQYTTELQNTISELDVVDTGNLRARSNVQITTFSDSAFIRFRTVDVPYAIYPHEGLSTSASYGPRRYAVITRDKVALNFK